MIVISHPNRTLMLSLNSHLVFNICVFSLCITIVSSTNPRTTPSTPCVHHCSVEMAQTRSMTRNQNRDDASSSKRIKSCDNGYAAPWSDLNHHLLCLVMMQLGVIDFLAFGGVCKSWRSVALANKNIFMESRPPMMISISDNRSGKKECYLEDFEGRKFKTILPHSAGRNFVGLTCGYLILLGRRARDFWLVNPITRHKLHFPCFPYNTGTHLARFKAILVYSPLVSGSAFVMIDRFTNKTWFSIVGTRAWNHVSSTSFMLDLHAFKGKIYTIDNGYRLCEMRLNPEPKLTVLQTKNFPEPGFLCPEFVNLSENLYVMDRKNSYKVHELDFDEMKWVLSETSKYAIFYDFKYSAAAIKQEFWAAHRSQYKRYLASKYGIKKSGLWYFPNDCLNVNRLDE